MAATSPSEFCLLMIDHWATCIPRADWAEWAGAIGTILALVIALVVAYWQLLWSRRDGWVRRRTECMAALQPFSAISDLAWLALKTRLCMLEDSGHCANARRQAMQFRSDQQYLAELDAVSLSQMPCRKGVALAFQLKESMRLLADQLDTCRAESRPIEPQTIAMSYRLMAKVEIDMAHFLAFCEDYVKSWADAYPKYWPRPIVFNDPDEAPTAENRARVDAAFNTLQTFDPIASRRPVKD